MPHLILEASANIKESSAQIKEILLNCQNLLVEKLPTQLTSCKSRAVLHKVYVVGNNNPQNAFVHLTVRLLKGRSTELLISVSKELNLLLKNSFTLSVKELNLGISVEILELSDTYLK